MKYWMKLTQYKDTLNQDLFWVTILMVWAYCRKLWNFWTDKMYFPVVWNSKAVCVFTETGCLTLSDAVHFLMSGLFKTCFIMVPFCLCLENGFVSWGSSTELLLKVAAFVAVWNWNLHLTSETYMQLRQLKWNSLWMCYLL
jgi:hypothetical protein